MYLELPRSRKMDLKSQNKCDLYPLSLMLKVVLMPLGHNFRKEDSIATVLYSAEPSTRTVAVLVEGVCRRHTDVCFMGCVRARSVVDGQDFITLISVALHLSCVKECRLKYFANLK